MSHGFNNVDELSQSIKRTNPKLTPYLDLVELYLLSHITT